MNWKLLKDIENLDFYVDKYVLVSCVGSWVCGGRLYKEDANYFLLNNTINGAKPVAGTCGFLFSWLLSAGVHSICIDPLPTFNIGDTVKIKDYAERHLFYGSSQSGTGTITEIISLTCLKICIEGCVLDLHPLEIELVNNKKTYSFSELHHRYANIKYQSISFVVKCLLVQEGAMIIALDNVSNRHGGGFQSARDYGFDYHYAIMFWDGGDWDYDIEHIEVLDEYYTKDMADIPLEPFIYDSDKNETVESETKKLVQSKGDKPDNQILTITNNHEYYFTANIQGEFVEGLTINYAGIWYLLQNKWEGTSPKFDFKSKYGYNYSWSVLTGTENDFIKDSISVSNFERIDKKWISELPEASPIETKEVSSNFGLLMDISSANTLEIKSFKKFELCK